MVQLLRFRTSRFDPAAEPPNPINPIPGQALLAWLCGELEPQGYTASEPDVEDWGWFVYVAGAEARYLIGASGEAASGRDVDWTLQIHPRRSLWERLRGANRLAHDAPLVVAIEGLLRAQPDFAQIELESEA